MTQEEKKIAYLDDVSPEESEYFLVYWVDDHSHSNTRNVKGESNAKDLFEKVVKEGSFYDDFYKRTITVRHVMLVKKVHPTVDLIKPTEGQDAG